MSTIPEGLLEQLAAGNVLLLIGEGIVRDVAGDVALEGLGAQLGVEVGIVDGEGLAFPTIAQLYEDQEGRDALLRVVRGYFEGVGDSPQVIHWLIAALYRETDGLILATTCLDGRLERAFEGAGQVELYKLYGSLEGVATTGRLVLTEEDQEAFFEQEGSISVGLREQLAGKTILFVGYDLTSAQFKRLYRKIRVSFGRRAYALQTAPPAHLVRWAKHRQLEVIEAEATRFLEVVLAQLADKPLHTDHEMQALLLYSALQTADEPAYWLKRINEATRRVELLSEATGSQLALVRKRAVELLGSQNIPQAVEPLVSIALYDPNLAVRDAASQSLAQLTRQHRRPRPNRA